MCDTSSMTAAPITPSKTIFASPESKNRVCSLGNVFPTTSQPRSLSFLPIPVQASSIDNLKPSRAPLGLPPPYIDMQNHHHWVKMTHYHTMKGGAPKDSRNKRTNIIRQQEEIQKNNTTERQNVEKAHFRCHASSSLFNRL
jgi:hypothetical protein